MITKGLFSSLSVDWKTPKKFYEELNKEFHFNDDPCPIGGKGGLDRPWGTKTFVNPPYGKVIGKWIEKGLTESRLNKTIVMLLPSRTDTKWFHDFILPFAKEIRFIKGRLKFNDYNNSAPFPSMVVILSK